MQTHPCNVRWTTISNAHVPLIFKGRILGIVVLTAVQFIIGGIHVFSGFLLLSASPSAQLPEIYSIYTLAFGLLTLIFTYGIWLGRSWGWNGTVAVSIFVIVANALALLNLPSIPGIPKLAAAAEIICSLMVLLYLSQTHVRAKYKIFKWSARMEPKLTRLCIQTLSILSSHPFRK